MMSECIRPVSVDNLKLGIKKLLCYLGERKPPWEIWDDCRPKRFNPEVEKWDFHNSFYKCLTIKRHAGLDLTFWSFLLNQLAKWKAIKGTRGITKPYIHKRGCERLDRLRTHYTALLPHCTQPDYGLNQLSWVNVSPLFEVASEIKPVNSPSPVFASKLCHFLCPSIFPVIDRTLVNAKICTYNKYWTGYKKQWQEMSKNKKDDLIEALKSEMPTAPCDEYPWPAKIFELCQMSDVSK